MKNIVLFISATVLIILFFAGMISNILPSYIGSNNFELADKESFDPVAQYALVHKCIGEDYNLEAMKVSYVRPDGVIHFNEGYEPEVSYRFYKVVEGKNNKKVPLGVKTDRRYKLAEVLVRRPNSFKTITSGKSTRVYFIRGIKILRHEITTTGTYETIAPPTVPLKKLWSEAAKESALPENAVAEISYSGEYNLTIEAPEKLSFSYDSSGNLR